MVGDSVSWSALYVSMEVARLHAESYYSLLNHILHIYLLLIITNFGYI